MTDTNEHRDLVIEALRAEAKEKGVHPRDLLKTLGKRLSRVVPSRSLMHGGHNATILSGGGHDFDTPKERNEWFRHQIEDLGRSFQDVAMEFGVSHATVRNHCSRTGPAAESRREERVKKRMEHDRILRLFHNDATLTNRQITDLVECSYYRVYHILQGPRHQLWRKMVEVLCPLVVVVKWESHSNFRVVDLISEHSDSDADTARILSLLQPSLYLAPGFNQAAYPNGIPRCRGVLTDRKSQAGYHSFRIEKLRRL